MKKGFTLVELLAVLVVLGLIIVFAMPEILEVMDISSKNVFASQLVSFNNQINTAYDHALNEQGISAPYCYLVTGLKQSTEYDGYVLMDTATSKIQSVNVYNKTYVYTGSHVNLLKDRGRAIPNHTSTEYTNLKNQIDTFKNDPVNNCVEANTVFD